MEHKDSVVNIMWNLEPPMARELLPSDEYTDETDTHRGTLVALVQECLASRFQPSFGEYLKTHFHDMFQYLADLNTTLLVEETDSPQGLYVLGENGHRHAIRSVTYQVACVFSYKKADMQHRRFEDALVSQGTLINKSEQPVATIAAVQFPNKNEGRFFVEPPESKVWRQKPRGDADDNTTA
jgi:hypothetical protein